MKNIKINPYPNFTITEECIERDIKPNSQPIKSVDNTGGIINNLNFNKPLKMISEFMDGNKRVIRTGPVIESKNEKYFSVFPNPVHLFFDTSITHFNNSEEIKKNSFPKCAQKTNKKIEGVNFLDIDADETHVCYDEFFKYRMNSIIMLFTSVEAFINHSIPCNYPNRDEIERHEKFKIKLRKHLPESLGFDDFWSDKEIIYNEIIELYQIRNDLIHLKTNSEDDFEAYFEVVKKIPTYNISKAILKVGEFMNKIKPDFIVYM